MGDPYAAADGGAATVTATAIAEIDWFRELVAAGALVVHNHSGGQDSQASYLAIRPLMPIECLVVVHADLGAVEWNDVTVDGRRRPDVLEHIRATVDAPVFVTRQRSRDGTEKALLDRIRERGAFPSPANRWCTSDFKRGPIEREVRRLIKVRGRNERIIVNVIGMRAAESRGRAGLSVVARNKRNSVAGREWWDYLPIHGWTTEQVFATIAAAGQEPFWPYRLGLSRARCSFCIMASRGDLRRAAEIHPELYRTYFELEREIGHTLKHDGRRGSVGLEEVTGIPARPRRRSAA
jgi:3'-phosphoadenosine 5'-phosphosulfate sulfotransferase (PAPS reductase)/FAD synthetase